MTLPVVDGTVTVEPGAYPSLRGRDGFLAIQPDGRDFFLYLLVTSRGWAAVSPRCTHEGCIVRPLGRELACPCHGSLFTRSGRLLGGPARSDLEAYGVETAGDAVVIRLDEG